MGAPQPPERNDMEREINLLTQAFIKFSTRMDERVGKVLDEVKLIRETVCELQDVSHDQQRQIDRNEAAIKANTIGLKSANTTISELGKVLSDMGPWVGVLKWAIPIIGTAILIALVGAGFWLLRESGAGLP